jgi:hypothetical protein
MAYNASDKFWDFVSSHTIDDATAAYVAEVSMQPTLPTAPPPQSNVSTTFVPLSGPFYLCGFPARVQCGMDEELATCQQLRLNTCHEFSGLPIEVGIENFFAEITLDENNRFSAGVYASDTCTGTIVSFEVSLRDVRLDRCTPFSVPGLGHILDFAVYKECELCVPDAGLATTMPASSMASSPASSTSTSQSTTSPESTETPESQVTSASPTSSKGSSTAAVAAGVAVPVAAICVLIVVVIARRQRGTHVPLTSSLSFDNPSFSADPEADGLYNDKGDYAVHSTSPMFGEEQNSFDLESEA